MIELTAPIENDGAYATCVTLPDSHEVLGTSRPVKVAGTVDGHALEATSMPSGEGPHWLPLRKSICDAIGKSAAGEQVAVRLDRREGKAQGRSTAVGLG
ncbi:DUF1905 domain-containing protein [Nocardioides mangrovicus]|uniref:DUF1905 domain-containing protein n=1 Tax=Nocardioides mangrovicus TaxID=2478913 RepID=A0A3L8P4T7_9ACTN|nr:DUF1905 domain-containing protein [Nocardioides mangrovicus]RLV50370.1 DUF1905 domain-containing protein [Nocardioides mangrovicus]